MLRVFHRFLQETDGSISVDWVILTAAIVAFNTVLLVGYIFGDLMDLSTLIADFIADYGTHLARSSDG